MSVFLESNMVRKNEDDQIFFSYLYRAMHLKAQPAPRFDYLRVERWKQIAAQGASLCSLPSRELTKNHRGKRKIIFKHDF